MALSHCLGTLLEMQYEGALERVGAALQTSEKSVRQLASAVLWIESTWAARERFLLDDMKQLSIFKQLNALDNLFDRGLATKPHQLPGIFLS